jgi:hypothetical protein
MFKQPGGDYNGDTHLRLEVGFMLRFMGGRFHMPGASITIPEGFYLNSDPELVDDFGVYIEKKSRSRWVPP